jgi:eukaryotic-like serine/threonine-protein kinase
VDGDPTLSGKILGGRFRLAELIGEGAMASVYRGIDEAAAGREVAVKVMHGHLAKDEQFAKRFRREARAAKRLEHPSTVQVFDYGVDGTFAYIAMELVTGEDLDAVIRRERRLSSARTAALMAEVASALGAAHRMGIVHRDLKPGNVMVLRPQPGDAAAKERVKVLDFGIAKVAKTPQKLRGDTTGSDSALTVAGMALGTPEYMSPEQCRGSEVDFRSDIYACGVLMYELCTGKVPFRADIHVEVMLMHVRDAPRLPREIHADIDPHLEHVIMTALAKSPAGRQQSTYELESSLRRVAATAREAPPISARTAELLREDPDFETAPTLVARAIEDPVAHRPPMSSSPYFHPGAPALIPMQSASSHPESTRRRPPAHAAVTLAVVALVIVSLTTAIVVLVLS